MPVASGSARFAFTRELALRIHGDRRVLEHFGAEYATASVADDSTPVQVEATYGRVAGSVETVSGGHKTVRWRVGLSASDANPLTIGVELRGVPRSFALSLTQGYFLEPVLSVAAARRDLVVLPCAGVVTPEGAVLLLGRSGSGKSSLAVRALAAGRRILGDDQVLVRGSGTCAPFPRRMRFYSDLRTTAPTAYSRLPKGVRAGLGVRRAVRAATRGYVAPPVRIPPAVLAEPQRDDVPLARVALIERDDAVTALTVTELAARDAARHAIGVLREQRARLPKSSQSGWNRALADAERAEEATLHDALAAAGIERIRVPAAWPAERAIAALAERVQTE